MTEKELRQLRNLVERHGAQAASELIGVHKTSVMRLLAGEDVRPNTEAVIRARLSEGIERGESRGNAPTTKRRA